MIAPSHDLPPDDGAVNNLPIFGSFKEFEDFIRTELHIDGGDEQNGYGATRMILQDVWDKLETCNPLEKGLICSSQNTLHAFIRGVLW